MSEVHEDKGFDRDIKYSKWRRYNLPRNCYCTDIDFLEWRNGKPKALIETRRAIGNLKTLEDVIKHFIKLNNGFQFEVYAHLSFKLDIPAYVVAIADSEPYNDNYNNSLFLVYELVIPKTNYFIFSEVKLRKVGLMGEPEYIKFLSNI